MPFQTLRTVGGSAIVSFQLNPSTLGYLGYGWMIAQYYFLHLESSPPQNDRLISETGCVTSLPQPEGRTAPLLMRHFFSHCLSYDQSTETPWSCPGLVHRLPNTEICTSILVCLLTGIHRPVFLNNETCPCVDRLAVGVGDVSIHDTKLRTIDQGKQIMRHSSRG